MIHNETIDTQLNHRSIRKFKDQTLTKEQLETLYSVFGQTPTSMFMQNASLLHVTDPEEKKRIQKLCNQKYVGAEGDLFIFIVDLYRNQQIRKQLDKDDGRVHTTDIFFQAMEDTLLAFQNVANAVESMGLGYVPLGTVNDHPLDLLKALDLPELTFPVLGMQVGVPDQKPQLKPRCHTSSLALKANTIKISMLRSLRTTTKWSLLITICGMPTAESILSPSKSLVPSLIITKLTVINYQKNFTNKVSV